MLSARLECALRGREPLDVLACKLHLDVDISAPREVRGCSADPARCNGALRLHLLGASAPLALRPRTPLGDEISRSRSCAAQLPRRGFASGVSAKGSAADEALGLPLAGTKRSFNPNGGVLKPGSASRYYMVPPQTWNDTHLLPRIRNSDDVNARYIILHGPSQSGKSTRILDMCTQLTKEGPDYLAVWCAPTIA